MENNKNYNELPNINDENEKEYLAEFQKIKNALIKRYTPLVKYEANKIQDKISKTKFKFLEHYGFFGLSHAMDRYNTNNDSDIKFETYASVIIQEVIYDELRKCDGIPKYIRKEIREIGIIGNILEIKLKRKATPEEIAKMLGITVDEYNEIMRDTFPYYVISLDEALWHIKAEALLKNKKTKEEMMNALKKLPQKEYEVLTLYYYKGLTLREIGDIYEFETERIVAKIHRKAIQGLKDILIKNEYNINKTSICV